MRWILDLEFVHNGLPRPDLSLFLDVPFSFTERKLSGIREGDDRDYLQAGATSTRTPSTSSGACARSISRPLRPIRGCGWSIAATPQGAWSRPKASFRKSATRSPRFLRRDENEPNI